MLKVVAMDPSKVFLFPWVYVPVGHACVGILKMVGFYLRPFEEILHPHQATG